jgi:hypothetical protein
MTKHILFPIAITALIIVSLGLLAKKYQSTTPTSPNKNQTEEKKPKVKINNTEIEVEIADTPEKRTKGLSGRDSLDQNKGMLFVFPKGSNATFWMKDMKFDLDIIWIRDSKIVKIDKKAKAPKAGTPDNKLTLYHSEGPIDYVLEANSGFSDKNNIKVGDKVELTNFQK